MHKNILIPGRHHAITSYQIEYLKNIISGNLVQALDGSKIELKDDVSIIWAVTSGNHANTRRNPIPGNRRMAMIELVSESLHTDTQVYLIPNMNPKTDFAHYLLEEIRMQSKGLCNMNPDNTLVACSTPDVIEQYQKLGFTILPVELKSMDDKILNSPRPWDAVETIIKQGTEWRKSSESIIQFHPLCLQYYERYGLIEHIIEIFSDPLTSDDGDITITREYESYRAAFEDNAFRKVSEFAPYIQPGRILDVGCATGQTIKLLSELPDLFESDFYGVEAARPLYDICEQRRHNGVFGNANVFFYQRNIMRSEIFPPNTINSIITMALTHEIESYMGRDSLLDFIDRMYTMLVPGGVYINYDVVAPKQKDKNVFVIFTDNDGQNPENLFPELTAPEFTEFFKTLSTKSRFLRFCNDFRKEENELISYDIVEREGIKYFSLRYGDVCDFLAKKDYVESWFSEMHERFCFWNYTDWEHALISRGFNIHTASKPITNQWLINNRFGPAAKVYVLKDEERLVEMSPPETNIMMIAQKNI